MRELGIYFTWPLFAVRLTAVLVLLPILVIISMFKTGRSYVDDKLAGTDTSLFKAVTGSFETVFKNSALFIIGGRKIVRR